MGKKPELDLEALDWIRDTQKEAEGAEDYLSLCREIIERG